VGGGVQHGEPAADAVERVVDWALGDGVELDRSTLELKDAVEYFPERGVGEFFDPRKHAVALTYTCVMSGEPRPRGKALDFRWFSPEDLPAPGDIGFGQASLIPRLLNT
jgi:ADP-ribose pyrophosphatase YjhB (NUDIX family)